jgi:uncharacterized protein YndB with AHSA1/START domain
MKEEGMRGEARTFVEAPPDKVWRMVTDVTRMGEWSPETQRAEWIDGADGPRVGARFRGHNRMGLARWSTVAEVVAAEPGREFAFQIQPTGTTWRYRFAPAGGGTEVTESYETRSGLRGVALLVRDLLKLMGRPKRLDAGMRETLARLKMAAEADRSGGP